MIGLYRLLPFLRWRRLISRETLGRDAIAGLTGAIVVLPQGVAFASIAGLPPQYGLYAGMIPAIVAALFGSSWHLVSGPTTAASVVLFSVLSTRADPGTAQYVQLALTLTLMVGVIQLLLGLVRMGALVDFISHSVLVGFTAGAAVLIAASQLKHFLGVSVPTEAHAYQTLFEIATRLPEANPFALLVGTVTIVAGIAGQRLVPGVPHTLLALFAGALMAALLELITSNASGLAYVPGVPTILPPMSTPVVSFEDVKSLAPAAVALTLFALTEAVSIARSLAIRSGQQLDGNQEFFGQGLSNVVGSFFSAYVATGSFNRSALNYQAGARTPVAAALAGLLLIGFVPLVGSVVAFLPTASMAGVLFLVAWALVDTHHIAKILRASRPETGVMATTFLSAVVLDLEFAILLGVLLSLFLYLYDAARPRIYSRVPDPRLPHREFNTDPTLQECPQLKIVRVDGSLFFGALHHVQKMFRIFSRRQPDQTHMLLIASGINRVDVSAAEFLAQETARRRAAGGDLYFYRAKDQVLELLKRGGYLDEIGQQNLFRSKQQAIAHIIPKLNADICSTCEKRIFRECVALPKDESIATRTEF
ncbi:MAG: SulP family inorganic anion transporter [Gammaproteobacteria bacterium]